MRIFEHLLWYVKYYAQQITAQFSVSLFCGSKKEADRVNALLKIPAIYESVHSNDNEILRLAAKKGDPRIVEMLLAIPEEKMPML